MSKPRSLVALSSLILIACVGLTYWWRQTQAPLGNAYLSARTPTEVRDLIRADAEARLTVVNFWASWCEPCKREFPLFLRLRKEFASRGVRVMFISVDDGADFADAESFLHDQGVDFPTFYKGRQSLNFVADLFPNWSGAVPATVVFGPGAEVVQAWEGDVNWTDLSARVTAALKIP